MNKVILIGRLTKDVDARVSQSGKPVARYTLAVDRRGEGADFISCITFDKGAEFAERYLRKGVKICVEGKISTGSYTNRDGQKIYTTEVVVDQHEFVEPKRQGTTQSEGFEEIPTEGFVPARQEGLPFA